jgi:hypothetical protein
VAYYLQALVPHAMPQDDVVSTIESLFSQAPPALSSVLWLLGILVVALGLAAYAVQTREYVLEQ